MNKHFMELASCSHYPLPPLSHFADQCTASSYSAISNVLQTPYCETAPGSLAPFRSSTVEIYEDKSGVWRRGP